MVDDVVERGEMVPGLDGVVESDLLVRVGEKTPGVVDLTRLLGRSVEPSIWFELYAMNTCVQ